MVTSPLEVRDLGYDYDGRSILDSVTWDLRKGEILGFGANSYILALESFLL